MYLLLLAQCDAMRGRGPWDHSPLRLISTMPGAEEEELGWFVIDRWYAGKGDNLWRRFFVNRDIGLGCARATVVPWSSNNSCFPFRHFLQAFHVSGQASRVGSGSGQPHLDS